MYAWRSRDVQAKEYSEHSPRPAQKRWSQRGHVGSAASHVTPSTSIDQCIARLQPLQLSPTNTTTLIHNFRSLYY
ncbi:hypothetical protein E2C01_023770 [Portunus trituberculatus]|uniref:Uncharacterized protein n=1 Tax=Portunus trituberculatus TaxID=210409 RepID=A0A5B7EC11_PORTR|nr:hypothetical protein [Portunus trituberculatus]